MIYEVPFVLGADAPGIIHPHFSHDGTKLCWSERIRDNGRAFGEWAIKIADFAFVGGTPELSNIQTHQPGLTPSFYETHGFSNDDSRLLFTGTQHGGLEIYEMRIDPLTVTRLTHEPQVWDEHAHYSPTGEILWMSSKGLTFTVDPFVLQAEFWMMDADGRNKRQLTWFNTPGHPHYMGHERVATADCEVGPGGKQAIGLCIIADPDSAERGSGNIVIIDLD